MSMVFVPLFFGGVVAAGETGDWRVLGIAFALSVMTACLLPLNKVRHARVPVPAEILESRQRSA